MYRIKANLVSNTVYMYIFMYDMPLFQVLDMLCMCFKLCSLFLYLAEPIACIHIHVHVLKEYTYMYLSSSVIEGPMVAGVNLNEVQGFC